MAPVNQVRAASGPLVQVQLADRFTRQVDADDLSEMLDGDEALAAQIIEKAKAVTEVPADAAAELAEP